MAKTRARTGDRRQRQQPLKIDQLPPETRDAIQYLKNARGKTWQEIEEISSLAYSEKWAQGRAGFVDWEKLDPAVRKLFPGRRLPHTNLHRWYDLRVTQVTAETLARAEQARTIAAAFVKSVVTKDDEAVLHAARDQIFSVLAEDASPKGRMAAAGALLGLAEMMQRARENAIKERKVAMDERKLAQMEKDAELKRKKFEREMDAAEKKITKGQALTADDINRIRERVFGIGPAPRPAAA
jgi:hypothetical protein